MKFSVVVWSVKRSTCSRSIYGEPRILDQFNQLFQHEFNQTVFKSFLKWGWFVKFGKSDWLKCFEIIHHYLRFGNIAVYFVPFSNLTHIWANDDRMFFFILCNRARIDIGRSKYHMYRYNKTIFCFQYMNMKDKIKFAMTH